MHGIETFMTKSHKTHPVITRRSLLLWGGVGFIVLAFVVLGLSLLEVFGGPGHRMIQMEVPGFHELDLNSPGLYAGIYQHRGPDPLPSTALSKLNVRVLSKETGEEIPVLMNNTGQVFNPLGQQIMPLFNFVIQNPGAYTLTAVYLGETVGPTVSIVLFPQSLQNVKQTLFVGVGFFILFLAMGVIFLVKRNRWAPLNDASILKK